MMERQPHGCPLLNSSGLSWDAFATCFRKPLELAALYPNLAVKDTRLLVAAGQHRAEQLAGISSKESVRLIRSILNCVVVREADILI